MMRYFPLLLLCVLAASCKPDTYVPKPKGYYHITFPERGYQSFNEPGFPYSFEYPTYGRVVKDTLFFGRKPDNPYWINIDFPSLGGRIYISYNALNANADMEKVLSDNYEMTFYHTKKADYIDDMWLNIDSTRVYGMLYNVTGDAASAHQFYVTDSTRNFIRGALYFDVTPNADSLKPVNDFLKKDIEHMLQTLRWH